MYNSCKRALISTSGPNKGIGIHFKFRFEIGRPNSGGTLRGLARKRKLKYFLKLFKKVRSYQIRRKQWQAQRKTLNINFKDTVI